MSQKNTLFNYFTKLPSAGSPNTIGEVSTPESTAPTLKTKPNGTPSSTKRRGSTTPSNSFKKPKPPSAKKRLVEEEPEDEPGEKEDPIALLDSSDEFVPDKSSESESDGSSGVDSEELESQETRKRKRNSRSGGYRNKLKVFESKTPSKLLPSKTPPKSLPSKTPSKSLPSKTPSKLLPSTAPSTSDAESEEWSFLKYDFLKPDKIRDAKKRRPDDPDYDSRTLHVPEDFLQNLTPAMRQWWKLKSEHYDCVLFFKIGKFYEFYHMDAVTAVKELSLTLMKGEHAHCGFPEISYGRFSAILVDKGYKVARIEQTETPDMMAKRVKNMLRPTKFDKVVNREICQLTTKGTKIFTVADGEASEAKCSYLLAVCEKEINSIRSSYGICFVDTSIGTFHIGQFDDDRHSSRLRTLIAAYPPVQVLHERNRLSKRTNQILGNAVARSLIEALAPKIEFWSSYDTLLKLAEGKYFNDGIPESLKHFVGDVDSLGLTASIESELGVRALGAVVWFLTRALVDFQLLSLARFEVYKPIEFSLRSEGIQPIQIKNMILDAVTLKNLNILDNGSGGVVGTLLHRIDNCSTPFGKRLLRQWMCSPSTSIPTITSRQKAVDVLRKNTSVLAEAATILSKVPDLERLYSRIYAQSSKGIKKSHPENRAVMFEEKTHSKRKITQFISVLKGFRAFQKVSRLFRDCWESDILVQCTQYPSSETPGCFPDLTEHLKFFKNAFDHEEAEKEGRIIPSPGVDEEYDRAVQLLQDVENEAATYLERQCAHFNCKVVYVGKDRKKYQLEVPEVAAKKADSSYRLAGQRKGFRKYVTAETKEFLERRTAAEDQRLSVLHNLRKRIFTKFCEKNADWLSAIECMATLDVLMSMAKYALSVEGDICFPSFSSSKPFVKLTNGKFPCIVGEDNFIPNDTNVGGDLPSIMVLTGPNMGGKSTLMRQLALSTVLAQMGCAVPAESMELTCVDRIFTRVGANDNIVAGESTFYVELFETVAIINNATAHSLVLIDELGRGTTTHDGTAIAASVLNELSRMGCRSIFSTHFHNLVGRYTENTNSALAHMSCLVDYKKKDGMDEAVTFLYKLAAGPCPKSYGFNTARLAGVPSSVVKLGRRRAELLEKEAIERKLFRDIFTSPNPRPLLSNL